ncbi:hypothetical protein MNBD_BACTEROID03-1560 [hydrothermal vent metagenome]|uniref:SIS domain-containing protein n=1 Tax=hydrothermal vent metagenome TaxID=652676 RepID=A0A3B0SYY2_9ZZZZ
MESPYFQTLKMGIDLVPLEILFRIKEKILKCFRNQGVIYFFGNGGSGATASHIAGDLSKFIKCRQKGGLRVVCLNDNTTQLTAIANDHCFSDVFKYAFEGILQPEDLVIGISGSGNSENVIRAINYANEITGTSIGLCGYDGGL